MAKNNNDVEQNNPTEIAQDLARLAVSFRVHSAAWELDTQAAKTTMGSLMAPYLAEQAERKTKKLVDEAARLGRQFADAKDRLARHKAAQQEDHDHESQALGHNVKSDAKRPRVAE